MSRISYKPKPPTRQPLCGLIDPIVDGFLPCSRRSGRRNREVGVDANVEHDLEELLARVSVAYVARSRRLRIADSFRPDLA